MDEHVRRLMITVSKGRCLIVRRFGSGRCVPRDGRSGSMATFRLVARVARTVGSGRCECTAGTCGPLTDPAIGGWQTLLEVRIRRFFCDDTA